MKPTYKFQIENCRSSFEAMETLKEIHKQISVIIESDQYKRIIDSEIPLFVYLYANPSENNLLGAVNYQNSIYVKTSEDIENDNTIFAIRERIGRITLPKNVNKCLIFISSKEIANKKQTHENGEDDETPEFIAQWSDKTFDDLILPETVRKRLFKALSIIQNKDLIFDTWNFQKIDKSTKSILCFYGPAGTGKTDTAKAIASYLNKKILYSTYAQIESQYVGVGAKNLHAIFKAAEEQDAILFFDEADSFLSNRLSKTESSSDKHYNRMSNELFQLLEKFNGCIIFATNLLTDVDKAFKSRIIDSIKFELPNDDARKQMISLMLPKEFPIEKPLSTNDWQKLVEITEGFSGRDIRKSVLLTLSEASVEFKSGIKSSFDIKDIIRGFEEVQKAQKEMDEEINGIEIDPQIGQELLDAHLFKEKLITMAKLALHADGKPNKQTLQVFNELHKALLGSETDDFEVSKEETIAKICNEIHSTQQKIELLDIAIKVLSSNGIITEAKKNFVNDVMANLSIPTEMIESIYSYTNNVAETNSELLNISKKLEDCIGDLT